MNMPIYILPGWSYDVSKWSPFMDELIKLGYKVKLLAIPGLTGKKLDEVWKLSNYMEWLSGELKDEKEVILIGHSNGGRIALGYVDQFAKDKKVKKLILIDSAGMIDNRFHKRIKKKVFGTVAKMGKKVVGENKDLQKLIYGIAREKDYLEASPVMKKTMQNLIETDLTNRLTQVNIPTILIWGENDQATPLFMGAQMERLIPDSKLYVVNGARHSPQFTHLSKVIEILHENI